jgi:arylsulfatase A-like enzyme
MPPPRSILLVHAHDAGRAFSPIGWKIPTPCVQAFAESGAQTYRQAFAVAPTCTPSRVSMLTGLHPHQAGVLGLAHLGHPLRDSSLHLVQRLRAAGYHTVLAGIQHEFAHEDPLPYETVLTPAPAATERDLHPRDASSAEAAARFLDSRPAAPFFLSVGFYYPHRPFPDPDPQHQGAAFTFPPELPARPELREDFAGFCAALAETDRCIGLVLDALDRSGRAADTLVVITTDHGPAFPRMKCTLSDAGLGVGLFIRPPVKPAACPRVDAMVTHLDLHATLLDYAGLPSEPAREGRSLRPWLETGSGFSRSHCFASINHHVDHQPCRSIRTERYRYVRNFGAGAPMPTANIDNSPAKTWWLNAGVATAVAAEELYDLWADPLATRNRADDPDLDPVRRKLSAALERWMAETADPLLDSSNDGDGRSLACASPR